MLINFAVVDELPLLRRYLDDRARAVEAVVFEIGRSAERTPHLSDVDCVDWFGPAIEIKKRRDIEQVTLIRTARFGGRPTEPLKHLGESQTIHVLSTFPKFLGSWIITDDADAYGLAKGRGLATRHTVDLLTDMISNGLIDAPAAFALVERMEQEERTLIDPPRSATDF